MNEPTEPMIEQSLEPEELAEKPYYYANGPLDVVRTDEEIARDLVTANEKYHTPRDPNLTIKQTLDTFLLGEYPSEIPDPATYISTRMQRAGDGFPGFNYGTFVTTPRQVAFAKLRYGPKNMEKRRVNDELIDIRVGGLEREAAILSALNQHGYDAPAMLGYSPSYPESAEPDEADSLETLYIEAIPPDEGTTLPPEQWTADLAKVAARKISTFAKPAEAIELFRDEQILLPVEVLVERAQIAEGDAYHQTLTNTLNSYAHLDTPIVVHGDTWLNNIIVKHDGSDALFVDWELAGAGYEGQDAGRTLWGLTLDGNWNLAEVSDTSQAFTEEWCKTEDDTANLRFGVVLESLRWIADRQDKLKDITLDDNTIISLSEQIDSVKQHTLKVLDHIR
jgi:hypothetical protein